MVVALSALSYVKASLFQSTEGSGDRVTLKNCEDIAHMIKK
jgi:hypothetical protein